jgi:hypothetical protein
VGNLVQDNSSLNTDLNLELPEFEDTAKILAFFVDNDENYQEHFPTCRCLRNVRQRCGELLYQNTWHHEIRPKVISQYEVVNNICSSRHTE